MGRLLSFLRDRLSGLSPEGRDYLIGAGMALDPLPDDLPRYAMSDAEALRRDFAAVGADMWYAIARAEQERRSSR